VIRIRLFVLTMFALYLYIMVSTSGSVHWISMVLAIVWAWMVWISFQMTGSIEKVPAIKEIKVEKNEEGNYVFFKSNGVTIESDDKHQLLSNVMQVKKDGVLVKQWNKEEWRSASPGEIASKALDVALSNGADLNDLNNQAWAQIRTRLDV
jgi:hypothetical protein